MLSRAANGGGERKLSAYPLGNGGRFVEEKTTYMLIALARRSRSCWLGWDVRVKRSSKAASWAGDILLRVLRCFKARAAVGVGEDELASESVAT
jgi:hypothetical protein